MYGDWSLYAVFASGGSSKIFGDLSGLDYVPAVLLRKEPALAQ